MSENDNNRENNKITGNKGEVRPTLTDSERFEILDKFFW